MVEGSDQESVGGSQKGSQTEAAAVPSASFAPKKLERKLNEELHEIFSANMLLALLWISLSGLRKAILLSEVLHEAKSGFLKPCIVALIKRGKQTEAQRCQIMSNKKAPIYQVNWMTIKDVTSYGDLKQKVNHLLMLRYPYIRQHPINLLHRFLGPLPKTGSTTRRLVLQIAGLLVDTPGANKVALQFRRADTFMETMGPISCLWLDGSKFCPAAVACLCILAGYQLLKAKLGMVDLSRPQKRKTCPLSLRIRAFKKQKRKNKEEQEFFRRKLRLGNCERLLTRKKTSGLKMSRGRWHRDKAKYFRKKPFEPTVFPAAPEPLEMTSERRQTDDFEIQIEPSGFTLEPEEKAFLRETTVEEIAQQSVRTLVAEKHPRLAELLAQMAESLAQTHKEDEEDIFEALKIRFKTNEV